MSLLSEFVDMFRASSSREPVVPDNFEPPARVENAGQIPITDFRHGTQAWSDMFGPVHGLPLLTEWSAASVSAIYACVNLISGAIATLPVNMMNVDIETGERSRIYNDPLLWVLNEEMHTRWPASVGWEFFGKSLLFEGDAFAIIHRDKMFRPIGLQPVHPFRVLNGVWTDGSRMVYRIAPEYLNGVQIGETRDYDQDDIIHVPGFGFNGLRGMSPLRYSLRNSGAVALAAQEYAGNFFKNGARPDYALTTTQQLGPDKVKELQERIDERHRGPENAGRPMLLHSGLDFKTLQISAEDMQLLGQRQFQIEEIARAYGVPPFMIGHNEKTTSWGSGVEAMSIGFVRYTLRQHLNKFEVELNRKLFRTRARIVHFDTSDLEQADTATLATSLRTLVGRAGEPRIITPDEARAKLRFKQMGGEAAQLGVNVGKPAGDSAEDPAKPTKKDAAA
jgi:HK97 family phage portal protein